MPPYQEEIIFPIINKLNISSKFKIILKQNHLPEKKRRDAAGEIKFLYMTLQ